MDSEYKTWKELTAVELKNSAKKYQDFPKPGVLFIDMFSITADPQLFKMLNDATIKMVETELGADKFNAIVGLESRGFIQGPILAQHFGVPFVPIRKKGKLPGECFQQAYGTEYSQDVCEI